MCVNKKKKRKTYLLKKIRKEKVGKIVAIEEHKSHGKINNINP